MSTSPASEPRQTLNQFGIAVAALIVGSALLFFAIGAVGATPDDEGSEAATTSAPTAAGIEATTGTPSAAGSETDAPAQVVGPSDEATPAPTTALTTDPTSGPTPQPTAEATATSAPDVDDADRVDPAEISVQVLDAIRDGSTTARDYADEIDAAGYDLVAFLTASRTYEQTTVFYSSGREALARQIADEFGWTLVRANDVGLSDDVDVGVVVGTSQN